MNTTFQVASVLLSVYSQQILVSTSAETISTLANTARRMHSQWAREKLALAIVSKGNKKDLLEAAWEDIVSHASQVATGYKAALALKSDASALHAVTMDLSPIALQTGESRTWTAVHDLAQLRQILKSEPELLAKLREEGHAVQAQGQVRVVWELTPNWLKQEVMSQVTRAKFARPEQKARVNGRVVKAYAHKCMEALDGNRIGAMDTVLGAQYALRAALNLGYRWADSSVWWAESRTPRAPDVEVQHERSYPGEEDWAHSTPIATRSVTGVTLLERWEVRCELNQVISDDYATAAEEAEALCNGLAAALEASDVWPVWAFKVNGDSFIPIHNKAVALDMLDQKAEARATKFVAEGLNLDGAPTSQAALKEAVLATFSKEEQDALVALLEQ